AGRLSILHDERRLLGERTVTPETPDRGLRVALEHLRQLALDARARRHRVGALAPVGVLRRMAAPARLRVQRGLERRVARGRRALRRQRQTPVATEKVLDAVGAN